MLDSILSLPDHITRALDLPLINCDPQDFTDIDQIVFFGMGGSGIAGNIIKDLIEKVPILTSKNYDVPAYLNSTTLAICASYSGNTKEIVTAYPHILKKNCRFFGLASGGTLLLRMIEESRAHVKIPSGMLPRASLPFQLFSLLHFLEKIGLYRLDHGIIDFARHIRNRNSEAREIAHRLKGKVPFIYGASESVCLRFVKQLNENAKSLASYGVIPEIYHNEVLAWKNPPSNACAVIFREPDEREEIALSIQYMKDSFKDTTDVIEILPEGKTKLEQIIYQIFLADLISYHLAKDIGVDPEENDYLNRLKKIIRG